MPHREGLKPDAQTPDEGQQTECLTKRLQAISGGSMGNHQSHATAVGSLSGPQTPCHDWLEGRGAGPGLGSSPSGGGHPRGGICTLMFVGSAEGPF